MFQIGLATLLGGAGSFWGPVIGAMALAILNYLTRTMAGLSELMVGGILIIVVLVAPAGLYGLGQTMIVGQLAIATFTNNAGLVKAGANMYSESEASGLPSIGIAGTGGRGTLIGGALEQSNVDIATEFTQMILAQRGYQANSKSITVADELMLETLNIKR